MKITFVRNTTMIIEYGGAKFLVDPVFGAKESKDPLPDSPAPEIRNPLVDLPLTPEKIVEGINALIVTHIHPGHLDKDAASYIPKDIPVYVQNLQDKDSIRNYGFKKTMTVDMTPWSHYQDIRIMRTPGRHGDGKIMHVINTMANSSGVILKKDGEKSVYITGDTIWYSGVENSIGEARPDLIIAYCGACRGKGMRLNLNAEELEKIHEAAPKATIAAIHLGAWSDASESRQDVRSFVDAHGFGKQVIIPEDGETFSF